MLMVELDFDGFELVGLSRTKRLMGRGWEGPVRAGVVDAERVVAEGAVLRAGMALSVMLMPLFPEGFSAEGGIYESPYFSFSSS